MDKCNPRTTSNPLKTGRDQRGADKEAQDILLDEVGGGWRPWAIGRPPWSADQARGPHRLNFDTWCLLIGPLGQYGESHPVAPCYKYKGVWRIGHTHTHSPHYISSLAHLA